MNGPKLTGEEQAHTLAALHYLRGQVGTWRVLAKALGFEPSTLRNVRKGLKVPSIAVAYRVSRLAGVAFDDVVAGRYPVRGLLPKGEPISPPIARPQTSRTHR
jgi:transcriptional regulator with XRE-family HTH domain